MGLQTAEEFLLEKEAGMGTTILRKVFKATGSLKGGSQPMKLPKAPSRPVPSVKLPVGPNVQHGTPSTNYGFNMQGRTVKMPTATPVTQSSMGTGYKPPITNTGNKSVKINTANTPNTTTSKSVKNTDVSGSSPVEKTNIDKQNKNRRQKESKNPAEENTNGNGGNTGGGNTGGKNNNNNNNNKAGGNPPKTGIIDSMKGAYNNSSMAQKYGYAPLAVAGAGAVGFAGGRLSKSDQPTIVAGGNPYLYN